MFKSEVWPLLSALLTGVLSGFFVSVPVGPINITILHEGVQRGFRWAMLIGAGAVAMETIYCLIGFAGFSGLFESKLARAAMELASFTLVLYLGIKFLLARSLSGQDPRAKKIEQRLHPHTAFMTGFVRVLGNPAVLLTWITLSATFVSHEWVEARWLHKGLCVAGVAAGATAWFALLSYFVARGQGKFSDRALVRLSQISGIFLLVVALFIGGRLVRLIAQH